MAMTSSQSRALRDQAARLKARKEGLAAALRPWMQRMARWYARDAVTEIDRYMGGRFAKADGPVDEYGRLDVDLVELLTRFGLRAFADSVNGTAGEVIIPPQQVRDAMQGKDVRIKWFWEMRNGIEQRTETILAEQRDNVREYVRSIVVGAMDESPHPSAGEVARRIRNTLYAADGAVYSFSSERAAVIARTEIGQAQARGEMEGYVLTSRPDDEIEWLSMSGGGRGHELMNGKRITIADVQSADTSRWFRLPDGTRMRYPRDPDAPIGHTINCRCGKRKISARLRERS
jgi:hypothetical protein